MFTILCFYLKLLWCFKMLRSVPKLLCQHLELQSKTGTSKSFWSTRYEKLWLTILQNHSVSHMPIIWFLNTAAQIESSHRNCPSRQLRFSKKFYLYRAWWATLDERKIAWNNHWQCGKNRLSSIDQVHFRFGPLKLNFADHEFKIVVS